MLTIPNIRNITNTCTKQFQQKRILTDVFRLLFDFKKAHMYIYKM